MSVLDAIHTKTARNMESLQRNEGDEEFTLELKPPGHTFQSGEYIRDLLDLENSRNIRLSRGKGIAKNLTEQFVSNPQDASEILQTALMNRKYKFNPDSYMLIQFTIVHME